MNYLQDAITLYTSALNTSLIYYNISQDDVYSQSKFYKRVPIQDIILNTSFIGNPVHQMTVYIIIYHSHIGICGNK